MVKPVRPPGERFKSARPTSPNQGSAPRSARAYQTHDPLRAGLQSWELSAKVPGGWCSYGRPVVRRLSIRRRGLTSSEWRSIHGNGRTSALAPSRLADGTVRLDRACTAGERRTSGPNRRDKPERRRRSGLRKRTATRWGRRRRPPLELPTFCGVRGAGNRKPAIAGRRERARGTLRGVGLARSNGQGGVRSGGGAPPAAKRRNVEPPQVGKPRTTFRRFCYSGNGDW